MARDRRPTILAACTALLAALLVAPPVRRRPLPAPGEAPPPDTLTVTVRPEPLLGGGTVLAGEPVVLDVEAVVSRPGRFALRRGASELGARQWSAAAGALRWSLSVEAAAVGPPLELVPVDGAPIAIDVASVVPAVAARPRVLVVDAAPRWEWRAAVRALTADPGLEVRATLLEADRGYVDFLDGRVRATDFPDADALRDLDVLVLGDVDGALRGRLPSDWHRVVRTWVEAGGGLVLLGVSPAWLASSELAAVTPAVFPGAGPTERVLSDAPFGVVPTALGLAALPLDLDLGASERRWAAAEGPWRVHRAGVMDPGAVLLAARGPAAGAALAPLVIAGPAGRGTVVWLGLDEAWRWRDAAARTHRRLVRLAARRAVLLGPAARASAFAEALRRREAPLLAPVDVSTGPRLARRLAQLVDLLRRCEVRLVERIRAEHSEGGLVDDQRPWPVAALVRWLEEAALETGRLERLALRRGGASKADQVVRERTAAALGEREVAIRLDRARLALLDGRALAALDPLRRACADLDDARRSAERVLSDLASRGPG